MSWRETLLNRLGPGMFAGVTLGDWVALLRENRMAIAPRYLPRAAVATLFALLNSALRRVEDGGYGAKVRAVTVPPPVFVLGHWRSGTTLLHNLLALDHRLAAPTLYQVFFPHTFLTTEAAATRLTRFLLPRTRLGVDNVRMDYEMAYEDEFADCVASGRSSYVTWAFPRRAEYYDRYLTFRGVPPAEVERWKGSVIGFVKKLTYRYDGRSLVLKSPPHTARVRLLLELFPGARFVHIHRDPYTVFQSSVQMSEVGWKYYALQRLPDPSSVVERVLRQYREMYEAFFSDRGLIPAGHYHEVSFEELERDPVEQARGIYKALGLPDFEEVEPAVRGYVDSIAGYRKNRFTELSPDLRERVAKEWGPYFAAWGYPA